MTGVRPRVAVTSMVYKEGQRELELKFKMISDAVGLAGTAVDIGAISIYRFNEEGRVFEHRLDNRIKRDLWEYSHSWMGILAGERPPAVPPSVIRH
ncbi:unnamed protein product [Choristocarpus tenellus]